MSAAEKNFHQRSNVYTAGEAVIFDETYIHQAENRTGVTRVILFCDIERGLANPVLRWINRTIRRGMIRAAATRNVADGHVGVLNHIFSYVYQLRTLGLRTEEWNKSIQSLIKWALLVADCKTPVNIASRARVRVASSLLLIRQ